MNNDIDLTCVTRMLDEFRGRSNILKANRPTQFPVLETSKPYSFSKSDNVNRKPFDETVLNMNNSLIKKRRRKSFEDSLDSENECNTSVGTPWETQHLRTELAQARAQIKVLENRISQLNGFQNIATVLTEQEKAAYKADLEKERNTVAELERRVNILKRREEKKQEELLLVVESLNREKTQLESKSIDLYGENNNLKEKLAEVEESLLSSQLKAKECENISSKMEVELKLLKEHIGSLTEQLEKLKRASREAEESKAQVACAKLRIKELESEIQSESEASAVVKAQQAKLLKYADLERQLKHLLQQNNKLKENVNNTIYLESVVEKLKGKLEGLEEKERELIGARVKLGDVERKLAEYRMLCEEVLGRSDDKNSNSPYKLIEHIRQLQDRNRWEEEQRLQLGNKLKRLEESGKETVSDYNKLKVEMATLKDELASSTTNLKLFQKQNTLLKWERNGLRSFMDSCLKDMTVGGAQMDSKLEALEKLIEDYRLKIQQIEPDLTPKSQDTGSEQNNSVEFEKLKEENEKLSKIIENLNYEIEHRALKGDFNTQTTKILHFKMNPTTLAIQENTCEKEKLEIEVMQLKERLRLIEDGKVNDLTQNVESNVNSDTMKELKELRKEVKRLELQNERFTEAFKTTSHEFREAIYTLLGYKVDAVPNKKKTYKLSNIYSDSPDHHLLFKMNSKGGMELLETDYSRTLSELVESVLLIHNSIPIFLASLTLDLFKRQTTLFDPSKM